MDLSNVEPNIVLILLGALFVLLGASGKIFIEKFSVTLASLFSRILIALVGFIMLTIGVIGPDSIFNDNQGQIISSNDNAQSVTMSGSNQKTPWYHNIAGTYTGTATSSGIDYPVQTTFIIDNGGGLEGSYVIEEPGKLIGGKLKNARVLGNDSIEFEWVDEGGEGRLKLKFSKNLNSFSGNWGDMQSLDRELKWDGKRK
ncbi:MAG: hypothetical protein R3240_02335 [Gammaproteobacteria bacterium]|nr:hypothetical protein [Gammaproteobacteria bacterium]